MGTTFAIASSLFNVYAQNKALEEQGKANLQTARNMITSMNYSLQNLEQERRDVFEATVQELERTQIQGRRLGSSVEAAVAEGLAGGGRTADMLKRASAADTSRALASVKDNYKKKSNEIDLNKETAVLNAKQQISSIREVKKPSLLGTLMQIGTGFLAAKQQMETIDLIRTQGGLGGTGRPLAGAAPSVGSFQQNKGYTNIQWDKGAGAFSITSSAPSYHGILGGIDWTKPKFSFNYVNPFTQNTQTTNYF